MFHQCTEINLVGGRCVYHQGHPSEWRHWFDVQVPEEKS